MSHGECFDDDDEDMGGGCTFANREEEKEMERGKEENDCDDMMGVDEYSLQT